MKKSLIYLAVTAIGAAVAYLYADRKYKEFKEHKEKELEAWPSLDDDIQNASLNNEVLDVEHRIMAKEIMEYYRVKASSATSIANFDKDFHKLTSLIGWIKSGDETSAISLIEYEHKKLIAKQKEREKEQERIADLERFRAMGTAFAHLIPDVNVSPVIKNCIKEAAKV